MIEKWTVEFEVDVEERGDGEYMIPCMCRKGIHGEIECADDYILDAMPDGLHRHADMMCYLLLRWVLVKREMVTTNKE